MTLAADAHTLGSSVGSPGQGPGHLETPLVDCKNLHRNFDVSKPWLARLIEREPKRILRAVDGVDLAVRRGETIGIVGESGSGKSTLARMVVGLLNPTAGTVLIEGVDMAHATGTVGREVRRRIQMIFQDPFASLNPRWRVGDIIAEPIRAFKLDRGGADARPAREQVGELLSLVGLDPKDGLKYPHEFSGGQRQRIAIARALASKPDFLVCDEPTSALDVSIQAQILNLMRDLQDKLGLTYLLITHNLAVVRHMADRVGVMYLGRLVEIAPTEELFSAPRHPYTRMLLEAVPDIAATGRGRVPISGEVPNPISPPSGCHFHPRCPIMIDRCRVDDPALVEGVACHLAHGPVPPLPPPGL